MHFCHFCSCSPFLWSYSAETREAPCGSEDGQWLCSECEVQCNENHHPILRWRWRVSICGWGRLMWCREIISRVAEGCVVFNKDEWCKEDDFPAFDRHDYIRASSQSAPCLRFEDNFLCFTLSLPFLCLHCRSTTVCQTNLHLAVTSSLIRSKWQ